MFFSGEFLKPTGVCTGIFGVIKIVYEFKICQKFISLSLSLSLSIGWQMFYSEKTFKFEKYQTIL